MSRNRKKRERLLAALLAVLLFAGSLPVNTVRAERKQEEAAEDTAETARENDGRCPGRDDRG